MESILIVVYVQFFDAVGLQELTFLQDPKRYFFRTKLTWNNSGKESRPVKQKPKAVVAVVGGDGGRCSNSCSSSNNSIAVI